MVPETITICGIPHRVMLVEDNFTMDSHFGEINYTRAEIRINRDMPEELQVQTLVHEWLHGALVLLGRNEETQDEQLVQGLAAAINMSFLLKECVT